MARESISHELGMSFATYVPTGKGAKPRKVLPESIWRALEAAPT